MNSSVFLVCHPALACVRNSEVENKADQFVLPEQAGSGENSPDSCALCLSELRAFTCFIQDCLVWRLEIHISVSGSSVIGAVLISHNSVVICICLQ